MKRIRNSIMFIILSGLTLICNGQVREIESVISKDANQKLHYMLAMAAIYHKDYERSGKSVSDEDKYKNQVRSLGENIVVNEDKNDITIDVILKKKKATQIDSKLKNYRTNSGIDCDFITASISVEDLEYIAGLDEILAIEPSFWLYPSLNQSTIDINSNTVWIGGNINNPINDCITGKNVLVGLIDSKPNFRHLTFENENGESRFVEDYPLNNPHFHGSHVAGIMAGRGIWDDQNNFWNNRGIAYESKIIWRQYSTTVNTLNHFIDMIDFSDTLPLIVNHSIVWRFGPRDGTTIFEQDLNDLICGNKIFVVSADNQSTVEGPHQHKLGEVPSQFGQYCEFEFHVNNDDTTTNIEIWHDSQFDIQISDNDALFPEWSDTIYFGSYDTFSNYNPNSDDYIFIVNSNSSIYSGGIEDSVSPRVIFVDFQSDNDNQFQSGTYKIRLYPNNGNGGIFNAYHCKDKQIGGFPDGDNYQSITNPGYSKEVITVAAHRKNSDGGDRAPYSSLGPSRIDIGDQVSKPDISAPGGYKQNSNDPNGIWSAHPVLLYDWISLQGTSMAAPHVAGAIALLMQNFQDLTAVQVKAILQNSAGPIPSGTLTPEDRKYWGAGKLNILAAYQSMVGFNYDPILSEPKQKFTNAFNSNHYLDGLPIEPVNTNWGSNFYYKQKMTNGAIFHFLSNDSAFWIGEGIWEKWIELDSIVGVLDLPKSSEFPDLANNGYNNVEFNNGRIYWDGTEAIHQVFIPYFFTDTTDGNLPFTVQLFDTSQVYYNGVCDYEWDFGDGTTSTDPNPIHQYEQVGTYTVSLTISDFKRDYTCTKTDYIHVFENVPLINITEMEYFLDEDPGIGNGTPMAFNPNNFVQLSTNINLSAVNPGLHRLYFRAKDENGKWSVVHSKPVYVSAGAGQSGLADITEIEYYFDELPSGKNGLPISFNPSENVTAIDTLDLTTLSHGLHRIYFRAKEENGKWSVVHSRPVYVSVGTGQSGLADITEIEYYFDDLSSGKNGLPISFNPSENVTAIDTLDLTTVSLGLHRVYFRAKDENGRWSTIHSRPTYVQKNTGAGLPLITDVEYFFDSDPGLGNGENLLFAQSSDISIDTNISIANIGAGGHRLYFRAKDSNGQWSLPQYYSHSLLDLRVFLEGPFNLLTGLMDNHLYSEGLIPLQQPFSSDPEADWFYDGLESVSVIPNSDVVDWVLVQYRDATSPGLATSDRILDTKPAFLLRDGRIRDLDGSSLFLMNEAVTQNLYTAIYHRNHLGVLSAEPMPVSGIYDFSASSSQVFGGEAGHKLLGAGKWGMSGGDANGNGIIDLDDKNVIWSQQSGLSGYKMGDYNLDSQIENMDKNDFWKINLGEESQIPD